MLIKRGKKWSIIVYRDGKQKWISTGLESRQDAELMARSMEYVKNGNKERFLKIVDAVFGENNISNEARLDRLLMDYPAIAKSLRVKVSTETQRKRLNAIGRLAKWVEENAKGVLFAREITVPIAWRFVESINATANTQRKVSGELSAVWESLMKRGLADENPWKVAKPQKDASQQKHGRAFTMDEVRSILDACNYDWQRHCVMIGLYTGLRLGDIFRLRWEHINLENGEISHFKPSKTARHDVEVYLPLHPSLNAYLARFRKFSGNVINASCDADRFGEYYFSKILKKAGLESDDKTKISFHCLRHTFATMLASTGATEQERMSLGGWTNAKTASIYNHDKERNRIIIDALPSIVL